MNCRVTTFLFYYILTYLNNFFVAYYTQSAPGNNILHFVVDIFDFLVNYALCYFPLPLFIQLLLNVVILCVFLTSMFIALVHLPLFSSYILEFFALTFLNYNLISLFTFCHFWDEYAQRINQLTHALRFEFAQSILCFLWSYFCLVTLELFPFLFMTSSSSFSYICT